MDATGKEKTMEWTIVDSEIWLTSVDITWERSKHGTTQRLRVKVDNDVMYCRASQWDKFSETRSYCLTVGRRHVISNSEVTALFNEVYFDGRED